MKVLIVRTSNFSPETWKDLPSEFRVVSEMEQADAAGFCEGFNGAELMDPTGLWALTAFDSDTMRRAQAIAAGFGGVSRVN